MNFNIKATLSIALLILCGICTDGHAKSHKKSKDKYKQSQPVYDFQKDQQPVVAEKKIEVKKDEVVAAPKDIKHEEEKVAEKVTEQTHETSEVADAAGHQANEATTEVAEAVNDKTAEPEIAAEPVTHRMHEEHDHSKHLSENDDELCEDHL